MEMASPERDGHGRDQAANGFIADQQRDQRQDDGGGEPGEIPELAGAKGEPGVGRMLAGEAIGQGGQQQCRGMGRHVQPVRDKGDGSEGEAAADLQRHHRAAQGDHRPTAAFRAGVVIAQEHVAVPGGLRPARPYRP